MMSLLWRIDCGALCGVLLFICVSFANAHDVTYADVRINAVFDNKNFIGVENIWSFDEVYTSEVMAILDENGDGKLSPKEVKNVRGVVLGPFEGNDCFNYVLSGTQFLMAKGIEKFSAKVENHRLEIDFLVEYPKIHATDEYSMLVITVYDPLSNIVMTVDMASAGVENKALDVEFFADKLDGLSLFRGFPANTDGLYVRFKKK